jgi:sulfonate transport system permease protein
VKADKLQAIVLPAAAVILAFGLWWIVAAAEVVSPYYLPSPDAVIATLFSPNFAVVWGPHLGNTLMRALVGYASAAAIAIPLGLAVGRSAAFSTFTAPIIEFLRPLPSSAIIPVALLFLGLGNSMQISVIVFGCIWPILVSTVEGARSVDPLFEDVARLLRFSRARRVLSVYIPAAAPFIAAGLRTSLAVSLILAVTAEMIAGSNGIGFYILDMERAFRTVEMYAAIGVLGIAGYLLNALFVRAQRRLIYWQAAPAKP